MTWPGDLLDRLKAAHGAEAIRARAQGVRDRCFALGLAAQDDVVQVVELRCGEVGCPDLETVVTVYAEGAPARVFKARRPMALLREEDWAAWVAEGAKP